MSNTLLKNYEELEHFIHNHVKTLLNVDHSIYLKGEKRFYRICVDDSVDISSEAKIFLNKMYWTNFNYLNKSIIDDYPVKVYKDVEELHNDIH